MRMTGEKQALKRIRFTLVLTVEQHEALGRLAEAMGAASLSEAARRAIVGAEQWARAQALVDELAEESYDLKVRAGEEFLDWLERGRKDEASSPRIEGVPG